MGNRFILSRFFRVSYSDQRVSHRLNESGFETHRLRPYGYEAGKFSSRPMFQENQSRLGNRRMQRSAKKTVRQEVKRQLRDQEYE